MGFYFSTGIGPFRYSMRLSPPRSSRSRTTY
jgi:hypothetical protein